MYSRWLNTVAAAMVLCLGAGASCSYKYVKGPVRDRHPATAPDCTRKSWLPYGDIGWAVGATVASAWLLAVSLGDSCDGDAAQCDGDPGLGIGPAVGAAALAFLAGTSSYYGYRTLERCREAQTSYMTCAPLLARVRWEQDDDARRELVAALPAECIPRRRDANLVAFGEAADDAAALAAMRALVVADEPEPEAAPSPEQPEQPAEPAEPEPPTNPFLADNLCVNEAEADADADAKAEEEQKIVWTVELSDATGAVADLKARAVAATCELAFEGATSFIATCGDAVYEVGQRDNQLTFRTTGLAEDACKELMQKVLEPVPEPAAEEPATESAADGEEGEEGDAAETGDEGESSESGSDDAKEEPAKEEPAKEEPAKEEPADEG